MDKTLYIHIGHFKTGTTALQIFLDRNGPFLAQHGFSYPEVWMHNSKHSAFAFSILRAAGVERQMYDYRDPTPPKAMWKDLFDFIAASKTPNTILSSEEFMRMGQFPAATDILRKVLTARPADLQVKAIAYLRDPDSHVQSWYNQLIKMNFPVADLNAALNGDIEDIHMDYRRALEPWIDILGVENVLIRPYIHDRENPAALHQDFMGALGIGLQPDQVKVERDPNPRFDDRVVELVRLMQNMEFPRPTLQAIRNQALAYLEAQDRLAGSRTDGVEQAQDKARAGLDWLGALPGCSVPVDDYATRLPQALPQQVVDRNLLLGFVFSEFIQLRQRVNNANLQDINTRLAALEARLADRE